MRPEIIVQGTMFVNTAAFVTLKPQKHLEILEAPYTKPGPNQLVVRNHAVAINPIDWMLPMFGAFQHIKWPFVLGSDSAGEVVEIGTNVTRFKTGDRVLGQAIGYDEKINTSAQSSFQSYTVLNEDMTSRIPDQLPYESACVLPLGIGTAACALFQQDHMALSLPMSDMKRKDEIVIIWGGSTSVGSNAIQLAVAAGYEVLAVCSQTNFEYCKALGATQCFDYKSNSISMDMSTVLKDDGKAVAGAVIAGNGGVDVVLEVFKHCRGRRFISMVAFPQPFPPPQRLVALQNIFHFMKFMAFTAIRTRTLGIQWNFVNGSTLAHNGVGKAIYAGFLEQALRGGTYSCKPDPLVVGNGLEKLQEALDTQKMSVSARKVVLNLAP